MSLKHALLGILTCKPMTGYQLKQFFDSSVQHFWNAELSRIYPTLKSLEESGWVEKTIEVQNSRPNRKVYELTDTGREEFERWVRHPQPPADLRDPFMIKVFFGAEMPLEDVLIMLRHQMEQQQMVIAFSETILREKNPRRHPRDAIAAPRHVLALTLEMANSYRKAYIEWCERSMKLLEENLPAEEGGSAEALGSAEAHAGADPRFGASRAS